MSSFRHPLPETEISSISPLKRDMVVEEHEASDMARSGKTMMVSTRFIEYVRLLMGYL
jgi:hypothetical protein